MSLSPDAQRELEDALKKSLDTTPQGTKAYPSEEEIQARFSKEFAAIERVITIAVTLLQMRARVLVIDYSRAATSLFPFLWPKVIKCAHSVQILASKGHGEDAMILARSLA